LWSIGLRLRLRISKCENVADYSGGRRFRFAIVDLDKGKDYPVNFVCMLPMQIGSEGKGTNIFTRALGVKSVEMAKKLLVDALKASADSDVKGEIKRRLKLLEPKPFCEKACVSCGKLFQAEPRKRFRQKFCPECFRKKFGNRK
jgi:hypothetical protein